MLSYLHYLRSRIVRGSASTNPLERLNLEIRRRTRVIGIFPHSGACLRLIGMLLVEKNDDWLTDDKAYLTFDDASAGGVHQNRLNGGEPMRKEAFLLRGLCPRAPGIYRFYARIKLCCGRLVPPPAIPALPESALRSLPSVAVPSAPVIAILNPPPGVGSKFTLLY